MENQPQDQASSPVESPQPLSPTPPENQPAPPVDGTASSPLATPAPQASSPLPTPAAATPSASPLSQVASSVSSQEKYLVFQAISDTLKAVSHNTATYTLSVIVSVVLSTVTLIVIVLIVVALLIGSAGFSFASLGNVLIVLIGGTVIYTLWYAFTYAFMLSATALPVNAGAEGSKSSLGSTLSKSLSSVVRVGLANLLLVAVAIWPILFASFIGFGLAFSGHNASRAAIASLFAILIGIGGIVWIYIALLRYALTPYVALFEPDVPITKTLSYSKHMMTHGGEWFVFKGFLLVFVISIIFSALTSSSIQQIGNRGNWVINIIYFVILALSNGVMVMLYRNRKAVRGLPGVR